MNARSETISKLKDDLEFRYAYILGKLSVLVPSQIRALRRHSVPPLQQKDLAKAAGMRNQSRISMIETPGANLTLETLARVAAGLGVGVEVRFVPFSEMLRWENGFSQDEFDVVRLAEDEAFHRFPSAGSDAGACHEDHHGNGAGAKDQGGARRGGEAGRDGDD